VNRPIYLLPSVFAWRVRGNLYLYHQLTSLIYRTKMLFCLVLLHNRESIALCEGSLACAAHKENAVKRVSMEQW